MKRKIVIISGLTTAGKTTSSYELAKVLPGWFFIDNWKIKEIFEPLGLKDRTQILDISKRATLMITKEVMGKMGRNIILQEAKRDYIMKKLGKDIKKYNYTLYSFFLKNKLEEAIKRDIKREKSTLGIGKRGWSKEDWERKGKKKPKRGDVVINTSEKNPKQVVEIILKAIKEKPKKHPYKKFLRKSW